MKKRILLADDDHSVRRMVARVLESADYMVSLAASGPEAVAQFRDLHPDLVLLELKTPGPEGWDYLEQIRRLDPGSSVIVITAWPGQHEQALQRGSNALMEKPLDLTLLLGTIRGLLAQRGAASTLQAG